MTETRTFDQPLDVVIIGAGPAGLASAIELGQRGIRCLVVERNDRVGYSPRAKTTNVRTREHLRRWGIADMLRRASPIGEDYPPNVVFATRMNGPLLARFENALNGKRVRNNLYSEESQWVPQYVLEDVLRQHACTFPNVRVAFNTELKSFTEREDGVTVDVYLKTTGASESIECAYLIGADGARSSVREAIGATMTGDPGTFRNYNIIFRAPDLAGRHELGKALMYWMINADVPSLLGPMDEQGLWYFIATRLPGNVDAATVDPIELIRRGTGLHDLEIEIVGKDPWVSRQLIADSYGTQRVYLAGDSCHLHPPFGGFGMNMGVGDGVDLGWKMAATIQGWGGPELLASYQTERRKVHENVIAESVINYGSVSNQLVQPFIEDAGPVGEAVRNEVSEIIYATKVREFKTLGVILGQRYENSPIIVDDGSLPPPHHHMIYSPSAHPGCLAPHLWLQDDSSVYDHFGQGFTLLVTHGGTEAADRLVSAAAARAIPLTVAAPGDDRLLARYAARFALIRPDQHVAWRGDAIPDDVDGLLRQVVGHARLRPPATTSSMAVEDVRQPAYAS